MREFCLLRPTKSKIVSDSDWTTDRWSKNVEMCQTHASLNGRFSCVWQYGWRIPPESVIRHVRKETLQLRHPPAGFIAYRLTLLRFEPQLLLRLGGNCGLFRTGFHGGSSTALGQTSNPNGFPLSMPFDQPKSIRVISSSVWPGRISNSPKWLAENAAHFYVTICGSCHLCPLFSSRSSAATGPHVPAA